MKKLLLFFSVYFFLNLNAGLPQEYYKIEDNKKQKDYFFNYMYKLVEKENISVIKERDFVKNYLNTNILNMNYNSKEFKRLLKIKEKYKIKNFLSVGEYLKKIDIIPPSIALAQAATESGWGKSRFIQEANNIFGHWTYNPKIGLLPQNRDEGAKHFIRIFESLSHSIERYMSNLNSNRAYRQFQEKRYTQRQKKEKLDGLKLSQTLINYSGIAEEYLEILEKVIRQNKLIDYDKQFYSKLESLPKNY
ncbi:MAG: glucosaminidase domain-containing protein [Arcobacter sp.]|nr:glucosaminidase domain-containing protein [Arcobacter sp.]